MEYSTAGPPWFLGLATLLALIGNPSIGEGKRQSKHGRVLAKSLRDCSKRTGMTELLQRLVLRPEVSPNKERNL